VAPFQSPHLAGADSGEAFSNPFANHRDDDPEQNQ
jgi:hypothetical protein